MSADDSSGAGNGRRRAPLGSPAAIGSSASSRANPPRPDGVGLPGARADSGAGSKPGAAEGADGSSRRAPPVDYCGRRRSAPPGRVLPNSGRRCRNASRPSVVVMRGQRHAGGARWARARPRARCPGGTRPTTAIADPRAETPTCPARSLYETGVNLRPARSPRRLIASKSTFPVPMYAAGWPRWPQGHRTSVPPTRGHGELHTGNVLARPRGGRACRATKHRPAVDALLTDPAFMARQRPTSRKPRGPGVRGTGTNW